MAPNPPRYNITEHIYCIYYVLFDYDIFDYHTSVNPMLGLDADNGYCKEQSDPMVASMLVDTRRNISFPVYEIEYSYIESLLSGDLSSGIFEWEGPMTLSTSATYGYVKIVTSLYTGVTQEEFIGYG